MSKIKALELALDPDRQEEIENDPIYNNYLNEMRKEVIMRIDRLKFM